MEKEVLIENFEYEDPENYCVKVGKYIEGGCKETFCGDINECPYIKQTDIFSII